jgi:predicted transcriptional regulator
VDVRSTDLGCEILRRTVYKQVHRNLTELEDIGVIEFEESGAGQSKKPHLAFDGLEIDILFSDTDGSVDVAVP